MLSAKTGMSMVGHATSQNNLWGKKRIVIGGAFFLYLAGHFFDNGAI